MPNTGTRAGDEVGLTLDDGVLRIEINRPDSLNAVTADVLEDMADAVESAATQTEVRVIVLSGAGRGFCAGADIGDGGELNEEDGPAATLDGANRLVAAIRDVPRPVVSIVQGPCAGVGVSIALSADLVLASSKAFFMLAFTKIGLMPDGGATAFVAASAGRAKAMRMALLAERLTAVEAEADGLVSHVFDAESFDDDVDDVISQLRSGPMVGYARTKHAINAATLGVARRCLRARARGPARPARCRRLRRGRRSAFNEKRTPEASATPAREDPPWRPIPLPTSGRSRASRSTLPVRVTATFAGALWRTPTSAVDAQLEPYGLTSAGPTRPDSPSSCASCTGRLRARRLRRGRHRRLRRRTRWAWDSSCSSCRSPAHSPARPAGRSGACPSG